MSYYGSWKINDNLTFSVNTHTPSTGAATNADSSPTYHVYEDETATPIITGTMSSLNSPNTVGFYTEQIALSAGNGFEKGKSYNVYVRAVVGGVAGTLSHNFQIEAEVDANVVSDKTGYSLSSPQNFNLVGNITGSIVGSVSSVTNPVTVGTNNDKTGYSLSSPQFVNISGTITNVFNVLNPVVAGVVTGSVLGNVNGSVGSVTQPVGISTGTFIDALVDKVWDEATSGHQTAGTTGKALIDAGSAGDPWSTALPGSYTPGQAGHILASRMPTGTVLVGDKTGFSLSSPQTFNLIGNITGTLSTVNTVANPVTVGTNNDKTGYSLSSPQFVNISGTITNVVNVLNPVVAGVVTGSVLGNVNGSVNSVTQPVGISTGTFLDALADKVWDEATSGHQAAGTTGKALADAGNAGDPWATALPGSYVAGQAGYILASRMPTGTVLVGDKTGFSLSSPQSFDLIGNVSGTITNVNNVVSPVTVGTNNDKTGYSLSSPQSVHIIGNITGTITNVLNVVNPVVAGVVTGSVLGNVNGSVNSVTQTVGISTGTFLDAIADGVWNEQISGHLTAGSTGEKLDSAGNAGDPWTTSLPGSYVAGQAGHILASRMPTGTVIVSSNQDKTGYSLSSPQSINIVGNISGTIVGNLTGSVASVTDLGGTLLNKIADYIWRRNFANIRSSSDGDAVSFRSPLGMLAKLVNRWRISGTTLTVYAEDDTTSLGTQTLTGTAGADPITETNTD